MGNERSCLKGIVEVVEQITYDRIPSGTVQKAKECLADFTGIFINGAQKEESVRLRTALRQELPGNPESQALWMGSTARMLDIDDGHRFAMAHPGVVVNAAAAAMALKLGNISGKTVIEAIVRGYEIYCYQGRVINPSAYLKRGIDATSVCGAAAAAVTAGTMLGLDTAQMEDAVSLAASLAGGLNQSAIDGSAQKYLVAGWGAKLGICAVYLARHGLGGPSGVFEGRLGFCNAFAPEPDLDYLMNPKLVWDINSAYMKRYACVRRIHATLDAVADLVKEHGLKAEDIGAVEVRGSQFLCDAGGYDPGDMAQAQTSVPYVTAILLNCGAVEDHLVHEKLKDTEISAYSRKIKVVKDPEIVALAQKDKSLWGAAKVKITLKQGGSCGKTQIVPYGDPELPLPEGAVREKFIRHAAEAAGEPAALALWTQLMELEKLEQTGALFREISDRGLMGENENG